MQAALIGLPQSGKSTLFTAVTSQKPIIGEPPAARHAMVSVPEPRLQFLIDLVQPKKITYANIEFVDFPGFSLSDAKGRDDLRKYLPGIRQCEVLVLVVCDFENPSVPAYRDRVNPVADLEELREELIFADLETVTTRIERLEKSARKPTKNRELEQREMALLTACQEALEDSKPLSTVITTAEDARLLGSFGFLTEKPAVVVYNVGDDRANETSAETPPFVHSAIKLCADIEAQIEDLDEADRGAFLEDMGIEEPARDRLIRSCYDAMGLMAFFTMGPKEVRAWTIPQGATAVEAAGKIHSDLARGFIRAETVAYNDLVENSDMKGAKAAGKVRQEGKTYIVQDGDVMLFKFNV